MSFAENLYRLMTERQLSNVALGKAIGVSDMAVKRWKDSESVPSLDSAIAISKYFGIGLDQLVGEVAPSNRDMFQIPILGSVSAHTIYYGLPNQTILASHKSIDDYERGECYALEASDDSMSPTFSKNTVLFIHQQSQCSDGDYVIVKVYDHLSDSGQTFPVYNLRQFVRTGDYIELRSLNEKAKKITYRKQDINNIQIEGIVVNSEIFYKQPK